MDHHDNIIHDRKLIFCPRTKDWLYQNFSKIVRNAKTFCYIAAHVTKTFLIIIGAVDRLNPAITFVSYSLMVRVLTTDDLKQKQELV
ncbi:hypothetical protein PMIN04_010308 [Paraphaeosphaeria minitans]